MSITLNDFIKKSSIMSIDAKTYVFYWFIGIILAEFVVIILH